MQEIYERLFVANDRDCTHGDEEIAVVHACKIPCHRRAVGYRGNLPSSHMNYLSLEKESDLFLNIIDPTAPLFLPPLFSSFLNFATKHWEQGRKLMIHCNQGESRAPSLALLFLAKGVAAIPDSSYEAARSEFEKLFPRYKPGKGIETYFSDNWVKLGTDF